MVVRVVVTFLIALALVGVLSASAPAAHASAPAGNEAASEGGHGAGGVDALNPLQSWKKETALWTAVIFTILLLVLWKYAWGPIAEGLEKRERRVIDEIAGAERANADAKRLLEEYHQKLAASESEVRALLEQARRDAEQVGRQMLDKARAETEVEKQRALREIETATAGALKDLAERSAALAVDLAGKIVQTRLDPKAHARLIEEAVDRFAKSSPNGGTSKR